VLAGFESRAARHVRQSVEGKDLPVFKTSQTVWKRFGEWHLTVSDPREGCHFRAPHDKRQLREGARYILGGGRLLADHPSFIPL
jgi:hypothetical protein